MKNMLRSSLLASCMLLFLGALNAQMPGPGAKSQKERYKQFEVKGGALAQDSVVQMDTVIVFDPESYEESMTVTRNVLSLYDYCQQVLGISDPDILLDGKVHEITNPVTYEKMGIQWNQSTGKIDTVSNSPK